MKKMKKVLFGALLFSMFNQMNFTNNKSLMKLKANNDMDYKILDVEDYNLYDKNDLSNFLNQGGVIINNNEMIIFFFIAPPITTVSLLLILSKYIFYS